MSVGNGVRLAIVGSVSLAGCANVYVLVSRLIDDYQPEAVISGGAPGVDTITADVARSKGMDPIEHLPKVNRWHDGFKPRNLLVAADCTHLVRIIASDSKTYGSGWTRDRAAEMGKPTREFVVCAPCRGTGADPLSDNSYPLPCGACHGRPITETTRVKAGAA
jgi:hypothetical protein